MQIPSPKLFFFRPQPIRQTLQDPVGPHRPAAGPPHVRRDRSHWMPHHRLVLPTLVRPTVVGSSITSAPHSAPRSWQSPALLRRLLLPPAQPLGPSPDPASGGAAGPARGHRGG